MDVTPLVRQGAQIIQSYKPGKFKISGRSYHSPVIVRESGTEEWSAPNDVADLQIEHFSLLADSDAAPDVVLLGTGEKLVFPPVQLRLDLRQEGLNVEIMDSGAASRTYNVLMAEGRRVVAALLPV